MSLGLPEWPEVGYVVIASVKRVESYGAYVGLDEYGGKEGLLHISEISSRWVRNIRNHVRPGQKVVLQVLRTDPSKEQVDLSLRRVSKDEKRKKLEEWKKERKAETLVTQAAHELNRDITEFYESELIKIVEHYNSLYDGLVAASKKGPSALTEAGVSDDIAEILSISAKDKIIIKGVTIQGVIQMTSLGSEGVEEIKMAFIDAAGVAEEYDASINISTMGAPKYRIELTAEDYKKAELALDKTVSSIQANWENVEGTFTYTRD
ncbi:MAG: translation initiation factor IF-2 subunit alpha [Candidatus Bathyarchaeota archaeon]|nr:translation initiation factor IF-2 subunit alpha [Candidatus Bathyarchaeota archaeon]